AGMAGTAGWGDSDVEEAVAALETLWRDPDGAAQLGLAAARDLAALSWPAQVGRFRQAIEPVLT
ncbi:hypothetical protein, partial [Streptomyces galilaeus]|uniref:hypothetical protein n=1 Tax=Streptomyces galilaeus TaxID=33899 RepID=UPI0038F73E7E